MKRYALFLELLVSLFLIALCLFPLLKPHFSMQKVLSASDKKVEYDRLAKLATVELKTWLYEHRYSWDQLRKGVKGSLTLGHEVDSPEAVFELKSLRHYSLRNEQGHFLLMQLNISFEKEEPVSSFLFLQRKVREEPLT